MAHGRGAVHLGRFHGVHGTGLQAGQQDEHHERGPLPDQRDDDGHQGRLGEQVQLGRGVAAEQGPDPGQDAVDQPVGGVEQGVLPDQGGGHRHHQERCDQQGPGQAAADELLVQQQGQSEADDQAGQHHGDGEEDGGEDGLAQVGSVRTVDVVLEAGEGGLVRAEAVPVQERDDQGHHERKLGDDDEEDQGRQQRRTPCPGQGAFTRPGILGRFGCAVSRDGRCALLR